MIRTMNGVHSKDERPARSDQPGFEPVDGWLESTDTAR
ncbi:hypothetical protein KAURM247S_06317 [Kitasatospora aureofaciens]